MANFLQEKILEINKMKITEAEKKRKIDLLTKRIDKIKKEKANFEAKIVPTCVIAMVAAGVIFSSDITWYDDMKWFFNIGFIVVAIIFLAVFFLFIKPKKETKHSKLKNIKNEEILNLKNFFRKLYEENESTLKQERLYVLGWYFALIALYVMPVIIAIAVGTILYKKVMTVDNDVVYLLTVIEVMFPAVMIYYMVVIALQDKFKAKIFETKRNIKEIYKKDMLGEFLKCVNIGLKYSEYFPVDARIETDYDFLEYGKMLSSGYIENVDDYFAGYINDKYIEMADIKFISEEMFVGFNGRFASILAPDIIGDVDIISKPRFVIGKSKYAKTGVYKFDKHFLVKKDEQKELFTLFDKNFLEFLGDFAEKTGIVFDLFVKDKIYIKFYVGNIFEPKMFGEMIDEYSMYKFVMIMNLLRELAERL